LRGGSAFEINVEEGVDVGGSNDEAALRVEVAERPGDLEGADEVLAFEEDLVAESEMIGAGEGNEEAAVGEAVVDGVQVGGDFARGGIGHLAGMVAEEKHGGLAEAVLNDGAEGSAVDVDGGLAARVVVAKLERSGAAERVAEHAEMLKVEMAGEMAGGLAGLQCAEIVRDGFGVRDPLREKRVGKMFGGLGAEIFGVATGRPLDDLTVGSDEENGAVGCIEADDDIAVAGEVFGQGGEVGGERAAASTEDDHRIGGLLGGDGRVGGAVGADFGEIVGEKFAEEDAGVLGVGVAPCGGKIFGGWSGVRSGGIPEPEHEFAGGTGVESGEREEVVEGGATDGEAAGWNGKSESGAVFEREDEEESRDGDREKENEGGYRLEQNFAEALEQGELLRDAMQRGDYASKYFEM
jgi:hypothetical protein